MQDWVTRRHATVAKEYEITSIYLSKWICHMSLLEGFVFQTQWTQILCNYLLSVIKTLYC